MNVEDTIRDCISNYPDLFTNRAQVLSHLFFVNGNGYDWERGELVSFHPREPGHSPFWDEDPPIQGCSSEHARELEIRVAQEQNAVSRRTLSELDKRCQPSSAWALKKVYPLCEYAGIMNIPDDIQPDWLDAAKEALGLAQGVPSYGDHPADHPADHNQKWLDEAGERISQLRAEREI